MRSTFTRAALTGLLVLGGFSSAAVYAHHSFSAMYDAAKPVRLVGKLTKVEWTNPHSYFHLEVKGRDGKLTNWACEERDRGRCPAGVSTSPTSRSATH